MATKKISPKLKSLYKNWKTNIGINKSYEELSNEIKNHLGKDHEDRILWCQLIVQLAHEDM